MAADTSILTLDEVLAWINGLDDDAPVSLAATGETLAVAQRCVVACYGKQALGLPTVWATTRQLYLDEVYSDAQRQYSPELIRFVRDFDAAFDLSAFQNQERVVTVGELKMALPEYFR